MSVQPIPCRHASIITYEDNSACPYCVFWKDQRDHYERLIQKFDFWTSRSSKIELQEIPSQEVTLNSNEGQIIVMIIPYYTLLHFRV